MFLMDKYPPKKSIKDNCDLLPSFTERSVWMRTNARINYEYGQLSRYYEKIFYSTMMEFNILPPNIVIRTSDYIQEIIEFIEKSIQTGDAYEFNSMVYSKECEDLKCDIHSGGCGDLHASSKNYCGNKSWVNYELGDGATGEHESTKFSNEFMKTLKKHEEYPRLMRFFCLLNLLLDDNQIEKVMYYDKIIFEFFSTVRSMLNLIILIRICTIQNSDCWIVLYFKPS
ncbi:unnamed protein product [Adineta steineri]|uniref:tRNA synthetases class I catalytic domain-containing protein n=1 Tax=Adineta steineri TaxID=433720 RepID=A0A814ZMM8_9BILA|nr:unnamed protein product [Adineta steineri]